MMRKGASLTVYRQCRSLQGLFTSTRTCPLARGEHPWEFKTIISSPTGWRPFATKATPRRRQSSAPTIRTTRTHNLEDLKERIQLWINVPVGKWTSREIAQGNNLLDQCLNDGTTKGMHWATRMLERWIEERHYQNPIVEGPQLVELLHRVLHGWRLCPGRTEAAQTALQLLDSLEQACASEKQVPDSHLPGNKAYSMVLQLLALQPKHLDTLDIAQGLLERRIQTRNADLMLWTSCLNTMAKCSPYHPDAAELAEQTLQRMTTIRPNVVCFASVLYAWAKSGRPEAAQRAQDILEKMLAPTSPVKPNNVCINTCIDAWAKCGDSHGAQRAQDLLILMETLSREQGRQHLSPDRIAYNCVIYGWAKSRDPRAPEYAEEIFDQMLQMSERGNEMIRPDEWTCTFVLDAYAKSSRPEAAKRAEALLRQMEGLHRQGKISIQRPSPLYASVINALANSRDKNATKRAQRLLKQVEALNMAETGVYNAVILVWSSSSRTDSPHRALAILRRMQQLQKEGRENVQPSSLTYNGVIATCANHGDAKLANELLEEMHFRTRVREPGVEPDTYTYACVIHACSKAKSRKRVMQLLDEMEADYKRGNELLTPNSMAYTSAIAAWENCGEANAGDQAEAILWRMLDSYKNGDVDAKPNAAAVAAAMRVWFASREAQAPERLEALLNWMDERYEAGDDSIRPQRIHYRYLIDTWAKSRRFHSVRRIESIMERMWQDPNEDVHPNRDTYNMLLRAIRNSCDRRRSTKCLGVLKEMIELYRKGNVDVKPSRATFHHVMLSCSGIGQNDQEKEATVRVLREVIQTFLSSDKWEPPNASTYQLLGNVINDLGETIDEDLVQEIHRYVELPEATQQNVPEKRERTRQYFWHNATNS